MATTTVGRTTIQGATTVGGFNPATLFSAGEQGVWYDPSDLSTLFQDSAGTIPVTALEQPVGRILDKSGRGNTATQATSANRPVVSARVNLLTYTETFASAWASPPSATSETLAPDGTSTASKLTLAGATQTYQNATFGTGLFTGSIYVKKNNKQYVTFQLEGPPFQCIADLDNVSITYTTANTSATITDVGNGWRRITITNTSSDSITYFTIWSASGATTTGGGGTYYLWGPDLRRSNIGVGLPVYQRVGAATYGTSTTAGNADYNANGFPVYLSFDGGDSLATPSLNFASTDKMTVLFGIRKGNTDTNRVVFEAASWPNNGKFSTAINANYTDLNTYECGLQGTSLIARGDGIYAAPITNVVSYALDIGAATSATEIVSKVNGSTPARTGWYPSSGNTAGTGNFVASIYYIGAKDGTSNFLTGNLYGLIVRGASSTANQITGAENWLNQKTAAY